jgi:class 3 adenylate cyclase/tetratricopeptide (TPR) repeat protein
MPDHLAARIRRSRDSLRGERKDVTVLFADIVDSTELSHGLDPEGVRDLLAPALKAMIDAVHRYEGTVNQVEGDGIMALFGAPIAHEDHAARACFAALGIQEALRRLQPAGMRARIGLHSGEVVAHSVATDLSLNYDAIGMTVNLARRLEDLAKPGTTYISAATFRLAEGFVSAHPVGDVAIRGVGDPVRVFELAGMTSARTRWNVTVARGLGRLFNRHAEVNALLRALRLAGGGEGQVVDLVGEAGIGKSRLVHEFVQLAGDEDWTVLRVDASPFGAHSPYLPIAKLLRTWLEVGDHDAPDQIRDKVGSGLTALDPELRSIETPILFLLDMPVDDPDWLALEPEERPSRITDAIRALLLALAHRHRLVLVFEDLHWCDAESVAVIHSVANGIARAPILILTTYRPEFSPAWGGRSYATRLHVGPLEDKDMGEFLRDLIGSHGSGESLVPLVLRRAEGRPLFLEETVRTLVEIGALVGRRGDFRVTRDVGSIELPSTVRAVLAARLDRLPEERKDLLQVAAIVGDSAPVSILRTLSGLSEDTLQRIASGLEEDEFLYLTQVVPERAWSFKHALTQEVTYRSVLLERRRALHAELLGLLEARYAGRLDERVEELAHHAFRGESWDKAAAYLRRAGDRALERSSYRDAIQHYERSLTAFERLPRTHDSVAAAIDVRLSLRNALYPTGEYERIYRHLGEAEQLAELIDDQPRLAAITYDKAHKYICEGNLQAAIETGRRACEVARGVGDRALLIGAKFFLAEAYDCKGEFRQAIDLLQDDLDYFRDQLRYRTFGTPRASPVDWMGLLASSLTCLGRFAEAEGYAQDAIALAEEIARPYELATSKSYLGSTLVAKGALPEALDTLKAGLQHCLDDNSIRPWLGRDIGVAYLLLGEPETARSQLSQALDDAKAIASPYLEAWCTIYLGYAAAATGEAESATRCAQEAMDLAEAHQFQAIQVAALRLTALLAVQVEPLDAEAAEDALHRAMRLARRLGMEPELAHCHLERANLRLRTGRVEEGRADLEHALQVYRERDMPFWREACEAALETL